MFHAHSHRFSRRRLTDLEAIFLSTDFAGNNAISCFAQSRQQTGCHREIRSATSGPGHAVTAA